MDMVREEAAGRSNRRRRNSGDELEATPSPKRARTESDVELPADQKAVESPVVEKSADDNAVENAVESRPVVVESRPVVVETQEAETSHATRRRKGRKRPPPFPPNWQLIFWNPPSESSESESEDEQSYAPDFSSLLEEDNGAWDLFDTSEIP